mmetsp:Transcript_12045/g.22293  ORF Transcript_12045/g.22293 Transcript_12045/m.22293 type:complete len:1182 (+) Transcript_12045:122-3667(+)|eukprot:CAMPEP_0114435420 /NCGR_PEP_ID=MMETSP0103-20121206/12830_1 /TAXON_ID=37642 ORGANISM="Paraphysomonas imperforata, Strain PA2" /NCGR_SAMPLE_ID=MMETSP0103 /ASSEMBLY_ACC=CAM_ASM_000201 /LENGTH=1181 /DNA_ID=CAMNT_0001605463 /DNA_START=3 /DNA_END=3548 /DNA_ORIENTATION=+
MADLDSVQDEINNKLEHGFDTRHIYQMFSTFVATIKNQANQIEEMQEHAERAEAQIENMGLTIRNMEMNIQGFVTLPPDDEDEDTLMAQRGNTSPNMIENAVRSIPEDSKLIKPNQWEESNSRPASGTVTPQHEQVRGHGGRRKSSARSWKYKKRRIIRQVSQKLREEEASDIAAEQDEKELPKENLATTEEEINDNIKTDDSNVDVPSDSVPTTTDTENATHKEPYVEDKDIAPTEQEFESNKESQQTSPRGTLPPNEETSPRAEVTSSPRGQVSQSGQEIRDQVSPRAQDKPVDQEPSRQLEPNDQNELSAQIEPSRQEEPSDHIESSDQVEPNRQTEPIGQIDPSAQMEPASARGVPSKQGSPRANVSPRGQNTSLSQEISGKPPTGRGSSKTDVRDSEPPQPQSRQVHSGKRSSRDRDMTSADGPYVPRSRKSSRRSTPEFGGSETPPMSQRYYDDVPQIDPTQTVNYRIGALEARIAKLTDMLEAQQDELDEYRSRPLASKRGSAKNSARNSYDFFDNEATFTENAATSKSFAQDVEEVDVDRDIDVREEVNATAEQQDDVATVVKKEVVSAKPKSRSGSRPHSRQGGRGYDDVNVLRYNDQRILPDADVDIISAQICNSDPMRSLLDRIKKSTDQAVDQGIKRLPKPPPQVTANEMLTDSIVSGIANSMLRRGLLDELRYEEQSRSHTPRDYSSPTPPLAIQQPTPVSGGQSVSEADLKAITDSMVTKNEILAMIKDQIKRIPPQVSQPPAFSFTPYDSSTKLTEKPVEVTLAPKKYQEMTDDIPDTESISVEDKGHQGVDTDPEVVVREATMGERAKSVLEQHVDVMEHEKASNAQLEGLARNMSMHVSMEVQKISSHYEGLFEQFSTSMNERQENNEKGVTQLRQSLYDLEASLNSQIQHVHRQQPKKKDEDAWKSDLLKVSQSINKAREDQRTVAKMLVEELENLQNQMKNRVDENRLEHLAQSIEEKVQQEMGQSVSGINSSMAKIIAAVRGKADRNETEAMIQKKIREAEESLRVLQDDEEPAGAFKCISCGTGGKRMSPNTSLESLSFASVLMSQSAEVQRNRGGDIDQTAAVLNRQAGLRPVSRQQKPMTPKVYTPSSAPTKEMTLEPLYRRAKHANNLREIPKIPNVTFGVGNSNQYKMDDRNEAPYFPNIGTQSAPTSKQSMTGGL